MARVAVLLLCVIAASHSPVRQGSVATLDIILPRGFPPGPAATALICRDTDGRWNAVEWRAHAAPPARLDATAGRRCRLLIRPAASVLYLASVESTVAAAALRIRVAPAWLRTIRAPAAASGMTWVGAEDADGVECQVLGAESHCLFVPAEMPGVIVAAADGAVRFAVMASGATEASWRSAAAARLVRVRSPGSGPVIARAITIERALKQGAGRLLEARPAAGVSITQIGGAAFWVEGLAPGALLELRSAAAATLRVPLAGLAGSPAMPFDVQLPVEEAIEGDVRAHGVPREGATVMLSRIADDGSRAKEEERPRERIEVVETGAAGRFRFAGLARDRYEVLAIHPSHGRARIVVTPPAYPRLQLKPRAVVRGRVIENGIPVVAATVQLLPALEAVAAARNPMLLAGEAVKTGPDGRFEVIVPDEGRVVLAVRGDRSSQRVDLGDAAALGEVVDMGDIRLEEPTEVEVHVDLPDGCALQAAGPMGVMGLSIVPLTSAGPGRWRFAPPAAGRWLFAALCGSQELALDPAVIDVRPGRREPVVLKVRR